MDTMDRGMIARNTRAHADRLLIAADLAECEGDTEDAAKLRREAQETARKARRVEVGMGCFVVDGRAA